MIKLIVGYLVLMFVYYTVEAVLELPESKEAKGKRGEKKVSEILKGLGSHYYVINNIHMERDKGKTNQIDHIVVSKYGIFVIETKTLDGKITGNTKEPNWIQELGDKSTQFYSPVVQNEWHIKTLKKNLKAFNVPYVSIIVFPTDCELCVQGEGIVIHSQQLSKTIKGYKRSSINDDQVQEILAAIKKSTITKEGITEQHKAYTAQVINQQNQKVAAGQCPWCGDILIEHMGAAGQFMTCKSPLCNFIK